jgi:putative membrane protein
MQLRPVIACSAIAFGGLLSAMALYAFEPASAADKIFVGNVSQGGMYEVEASKVAEQKAVAPDVKDTANTEVHDHQLVGAELKRIATKTGIPIAATLNAEFQQRLDKLKSVSGSAFDAAYIADMEAIHDKDEKLFAKEAMEGSGNFKTFAHQTDLIVKRHIGSLHGLDH